MAIKLKLFGRPLSKKRIFNMFWLADARQSHGSGLISQLRITNLTNFTAFGVLYLMFPGIPKWTIVFVVAGYFLSTYYIGYLDETKWHYWQFSNEKDQTYKVNPYQRRIERKINDIKKELKWLKQQKK